MTEQPQPNEPNPYPQLFKDNLMYQQLKPGDQVAVDRGIQRELMNIERNRILTPIEKAEEREWYLKKGALLFIENMVKSGQAMESFMKKTEAEIAAKKSGKGQERR
jgi:hypothetical protein